MQGWIRTSLRNRLRTDRVKKLASTHWNMKLLDECKLVQTDFWKSVRSESEGLGIGEDEDSEGMGEAAHLEGSLATTRKGLGLFVQVRQQTSRS